MKDDEINAVVSELLCSRFGDAGSGNITSVQKQTEFTLSCLKEHLDTGESLDAILGKLTMIGLEVEYPWRWK